MKSLLIVSMLFCGLSSFAMDEAGYDEDSLDEEDRRDIPVAVENLNQLEDENDDYDRMQASVALWIESRGNKVQALHLLERRDLPQIGIKQVLYSSGDFGFECLPVPVSSFGRELRRPVRYGD